ARPTALRKRIEGGRARGLEGRPTVEFRDRIVAEAVQADVEQPVRHQRYLTISAKSSGSRLAPPTSAPSISGCAMKSRMLPGVTLPPYWTRKPAAASAEISSPIVPRMIEATSPASVGSAFRPVPIAQIGS